MHIYCSSSKYTQCIYTALVVNMHIAEPVLAPPPGLSILSAIWLYFSRDRASPPLLVKYFLSVFILFQNIFTSLVEVTPSQFHPLEYPVTEQAGPAPIPPVLVWVLGHQSTQVACLSIGVWVHLKDRI